MDDAVWRRHANPWSAWTRLPILPLACIAIWARVWIGWWCLVPLALLVLWTWANPRAFGEPERTDSWTSRAVMGERVWLNRADIPIPPHHARMIWILVAIPSIGLLPLVWGLWQLSLWPVLLGLTAVLGGKLWFLDRMVWLFDDMATQDPYRGWLRC